MIKKFEHGRLIAFGLFAFSLWVFIFLTLIVIVEKETILDFRVFSWINRHSSVSDIFWARRISFFGTGIFLIPAYLMIILGYIKKQQKSNAVWVFFISVCSLFLGLILKEVFKRPRPPLIHLDAAGGYSFPSGHALGGFTFSGILIFYILHTRLSNTVKALLSICVFSGACLIGISRIYLRTHYASDSVASFFLAVCLLSVSFMIYKRTTKQADSFARMT
jgi:undecaprenyl-diphosphatase